MKIFKNKGFAGKSLLYSIILILTVIVLFIGCLSFNSKKITGLDWFDMQHDYIEAMGTLTASLDNVVSLYINGNIGIDDYYNHLLVINEEMKIVIADYKQSTEKYPVKVGTHTYDSKAGCEAAEQSLYETFSLIQACMKNNIYSDRDRLSYTYMAYAISINDFLATYMDSYSAINYSCENTTEMEEKNE